MANGGFAGGFAQGLIGGFDVTSRAGSRNRALRLQERQLEADEAARAEALRNRIRTSISESNQARLKEFRQNISALKAEIDAKQAIDPDDAEIVNLQDELRVQVAEHNGLAALPDQLTGQPTGSRLNPAALPFVSPLTQEAAKARITSPAQVAENMVDTAGLLATRGFEADEIGNILNTMAINDPQLQRISSALAASVPSQAELGTREGERNIAALEAVRTALVDAGVAPDRAAELAFARAAIPAPAAAPGALTDKEKVALRQEIQLMRTARTAMEDVIPLIDADSVGIMGQLNESFGGITSQLPGLREIQNTIGIFDQTTVNRAIESRNAFRQAIEFVKPFATRKDSRLSNQDRQFIAQLTGFLDARQSPEAVRNTAERLVSIMNRLERDTASTLGAGELALPGEAGVPEGFRKVGTDPSGRLIIEDEAGNTFIQRQ